MAIIDALLGGAAVPNYLPISYSGSYETYFERYDGLLYQEFMLTSSGTLSMPAPRSYLCDVWGIGGGGGTHGLAGGGSGHTAMVTGLHIEGDVAVIIGAGGRSARSGQVPSAGSATTMLSFSAAGGSPSWGSNAKENGCNGGDGGSGGGGSRSAGPDKCRGGVNGADGEGASYTVEETSVSCTGGTGDGKIMTRFYDVDKAHNAAAAPRSNGACGTGGGGYGEIAVRMNGADGVSYLGGYGGGAPAALNGVCLDGMPGVLFIRIAIG